MRNLSEAYDERERMPAGDRKRYYDEKISWVVQYAYQNAPAIRAKLDEVGINPTSICSVDDLQQVPITSKDEIIRLQKINPPYGGFLTVPPEQVEYMWIGPGHFYEAPPSLESMMRSFHGVGFRRGDIVVNTFSSNLFWFGECSCRAINHLGITVIPAGPGNSELLLRLMDEVKVTGLLGSANFLLALMRKAEEMSCNPRRDFSLRLAIHMGEMVSTSVKREIEEKYGIDVKEAYGYAGIGLPCFECSQKKGMHVGEEVFLEIVDPATGRRLPSGEVGEVVFTSLANKTYPMVRLATGDLSYYIDEPCPCGRTSPRIPRILGRVGDVIKAKNTFIYPRDLKEVMSRFPQVLNFQLVVSQVDYKDRLSLKVEAEGEGAKREELTKAICETIREKAKLRIGEVEYLSKGAIPQGSKLVVDRRTWD